MIVLTKKQRDVNIRLLHELHTVLVDRYMAQEIPLEMRILAKPL